MLKLGQLVITPAALEQANEEEFDFFPFIQRHINGDWGEISPEDAEQNRKAIENGWRVLSVYRFKSNEKFWIITEADRSSTCILTPEDY